MPVDVSQLHKLAAEFDKAANRVGRDVSAQVRKTTKAVEVAVRAAAPVDEGELRDSIDSKVFGTGNARRVTGVVWAGTDHARLVEQGTSRQAPQPFVKPQLSREAPKFVADIGKVVGDLL